MSSWSSHRRFIYGGSVIVVFTVIVVTTVFSFFYESPTCFDGDKNGDEQGIDCGGSCVKLCQNAFLSPKIMWGGAKFEKVTEGLYNFASYIANPNTDVAAIDVPYKFALFDSKGILITERKGFITLPAHRNTLAFEPAVNVGKRIPAKAIFEFTAVPEWFKSHDTLGNLAIVDKKYYEDDNNSSLEVTLENRGLIPYNDIIVYAVLYDSGNNAIGFSRTKIDTIGPKTESSADWPNNREIASFTWPIVRQGKVVSIEVLLTNNPARDK